MICKILPLYKLAQEHLQQALHDVEFEYDNYGLEEAIQAGLTKLEKYTDRAVHNDYVLLGVGVCPVLVSFICTHTILAVQFFTLRFTLHIVKTARDGTLPLRNVLGHSWTTYTTYMPQSPMKPPACSQPWSPTLVLHPSF
jgi:hypothetical protein